MNSNTATTVDCPSLRRIAGLAPSTSLAAASTALLLIDFQNEYFSGRLPLPDGPAALAQARQLLALAERHGLPVFHIRHVGAPGAPLFGAGSVAAEIHPQLAPAPHHRVLCKSRTSSFAETGLHAQLQALGVRTLIVAGLMTHMCVSTAVREARQFGSDSYRVIVAADACASRDLEGWDGGVCGHRQLHDVTLSALADNFAEVRTSAAILALPLEP